MFLLRDREPSKGLSVETPEPKKDGDCEPEWETCSDPFSQRQKLGDWASLVSAVWKRGGRIKLGFIWPLSAIPSLVIRFMAVGQQNLSDNRRRAFAKKY